MINFRHIGYWLVITKSNHKLVNKTIKDKIKNVSHVYEGVYQALLRGGNHMHSRIILTHYVPYENTSVKNFTVVI